jgi:glutathione peroxidase
VARPGGGLFFDRLPLAVVGSVKSGRPALHEPLVNCLEALAVNQSLYDIALDRLDGAATSLARFKGQVLLIVNLASRCGFTPQYAGLQSLFERYGERGLQVLGFPCNDFAGQEPGSAGEIEAFCTANYGVRFPLFEKICINGESRHPLYALLIQARPEAVAPASSDLRQKLAEFELSPKRDSEVLWKFEKFLVDRDGRVVERFSPDTTPDDPGLIAAIEAALA